jgi:GTP-binding protein
MTPIVAIVGRPNVGKSTLFNRLTGKHLAIVDDAPGVTRDRHYADAHLAGRNVTLVDTGGFDPGSDDPLKAGIARHVQAAIEEADLIVCVLDGTLSPTESDRDAVELLRRSGKAVVYVANKTDSREHELGVGPLYELGLPELVTVSALHGRGTAELAQAIAARLPPYQPEPPAEDDHVPRVAFVGRPNAGKSSLFNRLVGAERSLVDSQPGTTRDPVDERIEFNGQPFVLVDTAGIRRRSRVERGIELVSVLRAIRSIEQAEVCVLMVDASDGVAEQDARLLSLCVERRRAIIIGLNKFDVLDAKARAAALARTRDELSFARFARIVPLSARTGENVPKLMRAVSDAAVEMRRRIPTAELNRFFEDVLERQPPPTQGGRAPRIYYLTQAETSPPVFIVMASHPESIRASYQRFVVNQIRQTFGFESVPVTVHYKQKRRRD